MWTVARTLSVLVMAAIGLSGMVLRDGSTALLDQINAHRAASGVGPLVEDVHLTEAAQWLADDMNSKGYFSHTDSLGRGLERLADFGYVGSHVGENIAWGQRTGEDVFAAWRSSPGHDANMLDPAFKAIGIGRSGNIWVNDFGDVVSNPVRTPAPSVPAALPYCGVVE